jgi:hypothetical protein
LVQDETVEEEDGEGGGEGMEGAGDDVEGVAGDEEGGVDAGEGDGLFEMAGAGEVLGPDEGAEPEHGVGVAHVAGVEVYAEAQGDAGHFGAKGGVSAAAQFAVQGDGSVARAVHPPVAIGIGVAVPEEVESGAGTDFDNGEGRAAHAVGDEVKGGEEEGTAGDFVDLNAAGLEEGAQFGGMGETEGAEGGVGVCAGVGRGGEVGKEGAERLAGVLGLHEEVMDGGEEEVGRGLVGGDVGGEDEELAVADELAREAVIEGRGVFVDVPGIPLKARDEFVAVRRL